MSDEKKLPGYPIGSHERSIIRQIRTIKPVGNIIPAIWLKRLRREGKYKKDCLLTCWILSDIIFWYREIEIRDEESGEVVAYRKRFKSDMLQRNYQGLADQLGVSRRAIRTEIDYLVERGLIKRTFRNGVGTRAKGQPANNVMYLEPVPYAIEALTYDDDELWEQ